MFSFAHPPAYGMPPLRQAQTYHYQQVDARDRYVAAVAEAQAAETEYIAAIAREKAIQKQRHREETILRRLLLEDALREQNLASYGANDTQHCTVYPHACHGYSQYNPFDYEADANLLDELEAHRAVIRRHHQEEVDKRQRVRIVRQQYREQAEAIAAARHAQQVKHREQFSPGSEENLQLLLSLLFGGGVGPRKASHHEKQVSFDGHSLIYTSCDTFLCVRFQANAHAGLHEWGPDLACGRPVDNGQEDVKKCSSPAFGAQSDVAPNGAGVRKEGAGEEAVRHCTRFLGGPLRPHSCRSVKAQPQACQSKLQTQREPPAKKRRSTTCEPASPRVGSSLKDQLQSRVSCESEAEVRDVLQGLLHSIFGPAATVEHKESVEKGDIATAAGSPLSGLSLKEQLEARLHKDPSVEVHDTIQAILASLVTSQSAGGNSSSALPSQDIKGQGKAPALVLSSANEGKGKGKAVSFDIPATTTSPTSNDIADSMNMVHNIQAAFKGLSEEFTFPTHLDFTPPSSAPSSPHASESESVSTLQLAYTSTNAPIRYYEQALSGLLSQLDAIESWGNEEVRKQRKEIVARVEGALGEVEREVQERFAQYQARGVRGSEIIQAKNIEETPQSREAPVTELAEEIADVTEAIVAGAEDVSVPQVQERTTVDSGRALSDEKINNHLEENLSLVNEDLVSASSSTSSVSEGFTSPREAWDDRSPTAAVSRIGRGARDTVETTMTPETDPLYPSVPQTRGAYDLVTEPTSPNYSYKAATSGVGSPVDTFLLPATTELSVNLKRPAVNEEEEVVVIHEEDDDGEGSDGEKWSEVDA